MANITREIRNCMSKIKICIVHIYEKALKSIPIIDKDGFQGVYLTHKAGGKTGEKILRSMKQ